MSSNRHLVPGWMDALLSAKKWSQHTTFPKTTDCGLYISICWLNCGTESILSRYVESEFQRTLWWTCLLKQHQTASTAQRNVLGLLGFTLPFGRPSFLNCYHMWAYSIYELLWTVCRREGINSEEGTCAICTIRGGEFYTIPPLKLHYCISTQMWSQLVCRNYPILTVLLLLISQWVEGFMVGSLLPTSPSRSSTE